MALPSSGALSISMIHNELGSSSYSLRALSSAAGKGTPDAISEFYGYSNCPPAWQYYTQYCDGCTLVYMYHNGSCGYYYSYQYNSAACGCGAYYCQDWYGNCGLYQSPCWELGLTECGGGGAIQ
jgi:hypothetical protein